MVQTRTVTTLADLAWPRRTDRLTIRPTVLADAVADFEIRRDPAVAQWLTTFPSDFAAHEAYFADRLGITLAIELAGRFIGQLKIDVSDGWSQDEVAHLAAGVEAELGWTLAADVQGRGYATEAVRELLAIAFAGLGLRRVTAGCFAENLPSRRVMEKVGMRLEGYYVAESLHRDGTWRDGCSYGLLATEWADARTGPA